MRRRGLFALLAAIAALGAFSTSALANVHWIHPGYPDRWDSIWSGIVSPYAGARLGGTSTTPPSGVSSGKYALIINASHYTVASDLANAVTSALADPSAEVVINEIGSGQDALITSAAGLIGPGYPNRWGAFITYGSAATGQFYPNFTTPIDAVYANNGSLMPELYPRYSNYWSSATTDAARDTWLNTNFFNGSGKLNWLLARRTQVHPGSQSRVHPIFSASDTLMSSSVDSRNARFVDRVFYVYVTQSGFRSLFLQSNDGGAGSYKWDGTAGDVWSQQTLNSRDNWFANLWVRYAVTGATTPNWAGAMPAP
jgi:hypothetical protein